jgi:cytoskeleton protein RodZ
MSELAQSLGLRLKAERERRGMSTQKVADDMHLDAWVIEALEAGDYQRIGPSVYAKGHLKKYASILGMAAADIAAGFETSPAAPAAAAAQAAGMRMRGAAPQATNLPWPQIAAFAMVGIGVGGIFWWRPWHQRPSPHATLAQSGRAASAVVENSGAETSPSASSAAGSAGPRSAGPRSAGPPSAAAGSSDEQNRRRAIESLNSSSEAPAVAAGAGGASPVSAAVPTAPAASGAPSAIPAVLSKPGGTSSEPEMILGAGPARLRLSFSADSWVDVHDAAGRRVYSGNGSANSVKTIAGMAPLRVYLGFASGVQLEVNGRAVAIGPQFVTRDVARFEAGADGVLRRDMHAMPTNGVQTSAASPRG